MILLDTSIWLQFFRGSDYGPEVSELIRNGQIVVHEFVIGELLLGGLSNRNEHLLRSLEPAPTVDSSRVQALIKEHDWKQFAMGWVDACLAASVRTFRLELSTRDKALATCCRGLGCLREL